MDFYACLCMIDCDVMDKLYLGIGTTLVLYGNTMTLLSLALQGTFFAENFSYYGNTYSAIMFLDGIIFAIIGLFVLWNGRGQSKR